MESKGASQKNLLLGIPAFWKRQQHDWKITVVRTSLERFGYQMMYPYLSIFIIALGANKTELGFITSIGMILTGFVAPFVGNRIDQTGPKKIYLLGIAMLTAAYLTYSFAMTWQAAAVAMIIYYLGEGVSIHGCATICGNCLVNCDRAKGMLVCESIAAGLLGMLGPMLSAWILVNFMGVTGSPSSADQIRPLFYIPVLTTVLSFIIILTMLSNQKWVSKNNPGLHIIRDGAKILKGNRNAQKWLIIGAITYIPRGMILPFCQVFAKEVKGADVVTLGGMVTAAALTSVLFGYPVGALADKIGRKKVLYMIIPLFWLSNILMVIAPSPAILIFAGILQGFFFISTPLTATIQRELVPPEVMGRWIGLNKLITAIVSAAMALVSGIIYDKVGPQYVFLGYVVVDVLIRMPLLFSIPETLHFKVESADSEEIVTK